MQGAQEKDYTSKFNLGLWLKVLRHAPQFIPLLILLAVVMTLSAIPDVLFPLLTTYAIDNLIGGAAGEAAGFTARAVAWGAGFFGGDLMKGFILIYGLMLVFQVVLIYLFLYLGGKIEVGVSCAIRQKAFLRLQELSFSYYDKTSVGYLMSRVTGDVYRLAETIGWSLLDLCWGCTTLVFCSVTMLAIDWRLGLTVMAILPPLAIISHIFQQKILKAHRAVRKTNSQITGAFNEGIMGAKTTKTLVREEQNAGEFMALTGKMRTSAVRAASLNAVYLPLVMSLGSIATAYALWQGGKSVIIGGMTLGVLQLFVNYTVQFFQPVRDIASTFSEMQSAQAAAERVITLLETEPEIKDRPDVIEKYGDSFQPKRENWEKIKGDIEFSHVDFRYGDGDYVLKDFNLKVKAGETIALVGPTGAGKSTVVNLLCRFYEPTAGNILIDGKDYRERSQLWLQSNLGYVLQEPRLFSGTIRDNIRYAKPEATDEEVRTAAQLVNAEDFILSLKNGYDTDVGEGGSRLSVGEKQLVSFARAILSNPRLFILDEATSSVDTAAETMIQQAITKVLSGRTSFIIAHRLSTVRTADRILVISDGGIAESGTHAQLLARRGAYYKLYMSQFEEEKAKDILRNEGE